MRRWPAIAALTWAIGYTLVRLYWAVGGRTGYPGPGGVPHGIDDPGVPTGVPGPFDWRGVAAGLVLVVLALAMLPPPTGPAFLRTYRRLRLPRPVAIAGSWAAAMLYFAMPMLILDLCG
ncbi:hypothetical protein [Actinocatenispora rupis]|uniref:hypothetical protein n=1 Tax=Actinocatenispora rupis TaxID=519421 RepID=UPI001940911C|nr:hypothetical protein [Actinocatenispora rupis]